MVAEIYHNSCVPGTLGSLTAPVLVRVEAEANVVYSLIKLIYFIDVKPLGKGKE